ncbi:hypothetical protein DFJ73DRAFT_969036, partial [Zopfochytrium polystomum]
MNDLDSLLKELDSAPLAPAPSASSSASSSSSSPLSSRLKANASSSSSSSSSPFSPSPAGPPGVAYRSSAASRTRTGSSSSARSASSVASSSAGGYGPTGRRRWIVVVVIVVVVVFVLIRLPRRRSSGGGDVALPPAPPAAADAAVDAVVATRPARHRRHRRRARRERRRLAQVAVADDAGAAGRRRRWRAVCAGVAAGRGGARAERVGAECGVECVEREEGLWFGGEGGSGDECLREQKGGFLLWGGRRRGAGGRAGYGFGDVVVVGTSACVADPSSPNASTAGQSSKDILNALYSSLDDDLNNLGFSKVGSPPPGALSGQPFNPGARPQFGKPPKRSATIDSINSINEEVMALEKELKAVEMKRNLSSGVGSMNSVMSGSSDGTTGSRSKTPSDRASGAGAAAAAAAAAVAARSAGGSPGSMPMPPLAGGGSGGGKTDGVPNNNNSRSPQNLPPSQPMQQVYPGG